MTERTNALMARRETADGFRTWPLDIDGYCAWLNAREHRAGRWIIIARNGVREVDWRPEIATDDWLRERGMAPTIGRAA